jgi:hypothetical protein
MTTETQIEEIARRLGWEYCLRDEGETIWLVSPGDWNAYQYPETNADLHMRWMVEHGIWSVPYSEGFGGHFRESDMRTQWAGGKLYPTPHEAIRAALIAKLRSEQDGD